MARSVIKKNFKIIKVSKKFDSEIQPNTGGDLVIPYNKEGYSNSVVLSLAELTGFNMTPIWLYWLSNYNISVKCANLRTNACQPTVEATILLYN